MVSQVTDKEISSPNSTPCKRCGEEKELACTRETSYTICWDCLIYLDINHKDYKQYEC